MAKRGTRYPAEFKAEAIKLYRSSARSQREIADELDIAPTIRVPTLVLQTESAIT